MCDIYIKRGDGLYRYIPYTGIYRYIPV